GYEETARCSQNPVWPSWPSLCRSPAPRRAMVCMEKSMTLDEAIDAINAEKGCGRAMKVFQDCQLTASGDVDLGAAVEKKCEADFMPGLTRAQKQVYQREMRVCDRKYRNQSGT